MHFLVIKKKWLLFCFVLIVVCLSGWYYLFPKAIETSTSNEKANKTIEIHMVTGEFASKLDDGSEIEAYRWDPGTINIEEKQKVNLKLHGINGKEHHFHIEGTNISGVVKKGETKEVTFQFDKEGIYRLICDTHSTSDDAAPMIAYIVVD